MTDNNETKGCSIATLSLLSFIIMLGIHLVTGAIPTVVVWIPLMVWPGLSILFAITMLFLIGLLLLLGGTATRKQFFERLEEIKRERQ